MVRTVMAAAMLAATALTSAVPAAAQSSDIGAVNGTRLDVVATGEVSRVPDVVVINAGVMTQAETASEAIRRNAEQMRSVRAALRRAGVAERDVQTSAINLSADWRHIENAAPQFAGYRAHNMVNVRFRDIANAGRILDALVEAGANQIDGPMFAIDRPEDALDEARVQALATARRRAELYARSLGKRVGRLVLISESGGMRPGPVMLRQQMADSAATNVAPGEQTLSVSLTVSFELE